jgi:hypothetical protein
MAAEDATAAAELDCASARSIAPANTESNSKSNLIRSVMVATPPTHSEGDETTPEGRDAMGMIMAEVWTNVSNPLLRPGDRSNWRPILARMRQNSALHRASARGRLQHQKI